jgi:type III pantothenate kinase
MPQKAAPPLFAVDVGNNRIKLGWFASGGDPGLPAPKRTLTLAGGADLALLEPWLEETGSPEAAWWIGSVNRPAASRLIDSLRERRPAARVVLLAAGDLPLEVALERPDMVGVDRLLDAVAANALRRSGRPAVVVDVGTAITVDLVSADGVFQGGAILPGIGMSARALHEFTDLLPLVEEDELVAPPPPVGPATDAAMRSGLFWGAVGSIRELVARLGQRAGAPPQVFLTGGAGPVVADLLGPDAAHVPHLTLAGIALAARA